MIILVSRITRMTQKYNPNSSLVSKSYAFFQLIFVSLISTVFIELGELNLLQGIVVAISMVSTAYCVSLWLDSKKALLVDAFRIVFLIGVFLTSFFLSIERISLRKNETSLEISNIRGKFFFSVSTLYW